MSEESKNSSGNEIPRVTGLLVIEVRNSNPNGDPDRESDPRQRSHDKRGVISDVSFKRKLRELVLNKEAPVWTELGKGLDGDEFKIHVDQTTRDDIKDITNLVAIKRAAWQSAKSAAKKKGATAEDAKAELQAFGEYTAAFKASHWDVRVFGSTALEAGDSFIRTGVAQFGIGVSVAPIRIQRDTNTVKANVDAEKDADRGMAPLGFRIVEHGVYAMPFLINPTAAVHSGCTVEDIKLLCRLIPYAYAHNPSRIRPLVEVRHAWYFEHKSQLGNASDFAIIDALTPTKSDPNTPSSSWDDYGYKAGEVSKRIEEQFSGKFANEKFGDLCDPDFVEKLFV